MHVYNGNHTNKEGFTMTFKVFTNDQLSNDEYHNNEGWAAEYVSGSSLSDIHSSCPAAWKFANRQPSKALEFGTQSHTNFESKELFESQYMRATDPDDVKDLITSQAALASKLKSFGLSGTSGKQYPELIKMMVDCGEDLNVLWLIEMIEQNVAVSNGKELVSAKAYDSCVAMRNVLESIPEHNACMNSVTAMREFSIFGELLCVKDEDGSDIEGSGVKTKVRLDSVDYCENVKASVVIGYEDGIPVVEQVVYPNALVITDYKTTSSANPKEFSKLAYDHGYYLKMALQRDMLAKALKVGAFGDSIPQGTPIVVRLLAQEKKEPFLPMAFRMTSEQLKIGRLQYMSVIQTYRMCAKNDVWPSYEMGEPEIDLTIPAWIRNQFKDVLGK